MSKYKYESGGIIRDTELDMPYHTDDIVDLLEEKDKQLAKLEAENLSLQEQSIRDNQNWIAETTELQQQLKEKDEEVERQKEYYRLAKVEQNYWVDDFNKRLANNTKQVCEKIRDDFIKTHNQKHSAVEDPMDYRYKVAYNECLYDLGNFLDKIEKGEDNEV